MGLDMCRYMNDRAAQHAAAFGGRMVALGIVLPRASKAVFADIVRSLDITEEEKALVLGGNAV